MSWDCWDRQVSQQEFNAFLQEVQAATLHVPDAIVTEVHRDVNHEPRLQWINPLCAVRTVDPLAGGRTGRILSVFYSRGDGVCFARICDPMTPAAEYHINPTAAGPLLYGNQFA